MKRGRQQVEKGELLQRQALTEAAKVWKALVRAGYSAYFTNREGGFVLEGRSDGALILRYVRAVPCERLQHLKVLMVYGMSLEAVGYVVARDGDRLIITRTGATTDDSLPKAG